MKLLEKTVFEPAYQGVQSGSGTLIRNHRNEAAYNTPPWLYEELKRVHRWICTIRTALLRTTPEKTPDARPVKPAHTPAPIDHSPGRDTPVAFDDMRMPWVKADRPNQYHAYLTVNRLKANRHHLAGRSILCVGGRAALYPDYHRLIEAAGGHFMVFRGGAQDNTDCLLALLDCVSTVICPADCINHEDFFTVKRYCQRTRKYCAILERSDLATFSKAVEILARDCHYYVHPQSLSRSLV